jgi:hypothetical protein
MHVVQDEKVDDELLELVRTRKPYGATVTGLGDRTDVCEPDPFFEESLPAALVASIRATKEPKPLAPSCGPPSPNAAEDRLAFPFETQILGRSLVSCRTVWGLMPRRAGLGMERAARSPSFRSRLRPPCRVTM